MTPQTKNILFGLSFFLILTIGTYIFWPACSDCPPDSLPDTTSVALKEINFSIDISGSMNGYRTATEFPRVVSDVLGKSSQLVPTHESTKISLAGDTLVAFGNGNKLIDFTKSLAYKISFEDNRSSDLVKLLYRVADQTANGTISIFVSDCLPAFPKDVKQNPQANLVYANGPFKTAINQIFDRLQRRNVAAAVYAYKSDFDGLYFDFLLDSITVSKAEKRPFYIWILGHQSLLPGFLRDLMGKLSRDNYPEHYLTFGLPVGKQLSHDFLNDYNREGEWEIEDSITVEDFGQQGQLALAVDLSNLPSYARDESYLKKSLLAKAERGVKVSVADVKKVDNLTELDSEDQLVAGQKTHVITLRVDRFDSANCVIKILLAHEPEDWYKQWSTLDDRTKNGRLEKTFALEQLISGAIEAYRTPNENLIDLKLTLKD